MIVFFLLTTAKLERKQSLVKPGVKTDSGFADHWEPWTSSQWAEQET